MFPHVTSWDLSGLGLSYFWFSVCLLGTGLAGTSGMASHTTSSWKGLILKNS